MAILFRSHLRCFGVRREGLKWAATYTAEDGIERPMPGGGRYWRKSSAVREVTTAMVMWNDGLWQSGAHPLQLVDIEPVGN